MKFIRTDKGNILDLIFHQPNTVWIVRLAYQGYSINLIQFIILL